MYYWIDTINLICDVFEVDDIDIAKKLNMTKSPFSKIKNGHQRMPKVADEIYLRIFNPEQADSLIKDTMNCTPFVRQV